MYSKIQTLARKTPSWLGLVDLLDAINQPQSPILTNDEKSLFEDLKNRPIGKTPDEGLHEAIKYLENQLNSEEDRKATIESKAISLLGFSGIVTTLMLDLLSVIEKLSIYTKFVVMAGSLYLLMATILSLEAVRVGKFAFTQPAISNVLDFVDKRSSSSRLLHQQSVDLLQAYLSNRHVINAKATYVSVAQKWFRNAVVLFIIGQVIVLFL